MTKPLPHYYYFVTIADQAMNMHKGITLPTKSVLFDNETRFKMNVISKATLQYAIDTGYLNYCHYSEIKIKAAAFKDIDLKHFQDFRVTIKEAKSLYQLHTVKLYSIEKEVFLPRDMITSWKIYHIGEGIKDRSYINDNRFIKGLV